MPEIRAVLARGGTSRGLIIHRRDLPAVSAGERAETFARWLGSPDPTRRQIDGVGGGNASTSKIAIVGPPLTSDWDVDCEFFQLDVVTGAADSTATCGNLMAAVAQFAVHEGLVPAVEPVTRVRIRSVNTSQTVHADVPVLGRRVRYEGDIEMAGVPGTGAGIHLEFASPGGRTTGALLPTSRLRDQIDLGGRTTTATIVDAVAPSVFVEADTIHPAPPLDPVILESDKHLMETLELARRWGAVACHLSSSPGSAAVESPYAPLVGLLFGDDEQQRQGNLRGTVRMLSGGSVHRALPLGAGLAAGAVVCLRWLQDADLEARSIHESVRLQHPSGELVVQVSAARNETDDWQIDGLSATITARRIFAGVLC